ncbi:MAG TPA: hypothetical protein PKD05_23240, partial [Candidatus Melainabacteria bacterium]|nr:hypothetical protein [Candidatus Melainabacteria bacterium]
DKECKTMTTATITTERYADELHDLFTTLFHRVLKKASIDEASWKHRIATFDYTTLLEFVVPSPIKPKPIEVDESKLEDARYRRTLIRKLKAPRPSKWARHKLQIDRNKISDDTYCEQMAKVLAYQWMKRLMPFESYTEILMIRQSTVEDLEYLLDNTRLNCVSAQRCSGMLMHRLADSLVANNPTFKKIESMIRSVGQDARAKLSAALASMREETMTSFKASCDRTIEDSNKKFDNLLAGIRERLQESARRSQAVLDEHGIDPNEDREETFRRSVLRKEAERRAEAKARWRQKPLWVRLLPGLSSVAVLVGLFFHMEIADVTPYEWLRLQFAD